ncbi:nucleotide disphospho-sugar-binding domain-containing protein [Bifidobacterium aemilianum]|uniref:nucleotide disphospho-sugar-binding domain-containing protein n=1 Tax=Bifidobacterium aemilianum TaxID=2493120 RepID=UPI001374ECAF|nr:glycosyltransferase [Bifidobacterium aemilianum]
MEAGFEVTYICDSRWRREIEETGATFVPYDNYPEHPTKTQSTVEVFFAAPRTLLRLGESGDYAALLYEGGIFAYGKCLADRLGIPTIRFYSTFAYNRDIFRRMSGSGGLHVSGLMGSDLLLKPLSRLMQKRGLIQNDNLITKMTENHPTLTYVYTSRSFQIDGDSFPADKFKFIGPSLDGRGCENLADLRSDGTQADGRKPTEQSYNEPTRVDNTGSPHTAPAKTTATDASTVIITTPDQDRHETNPANTASTHPQPPQQSQQPQLIYASLGTLFSTFLLFYRSCIAAVANQPVRLVMSVGRHFDRAKLGTLPANVQVFDSVDQIAVLKEAALFITHGGMNSVNEALYYQVPMLVVPMADDQPTVAARVQELELGQVLPKPLEQSVRQPVNCCIPPKFTRTLSR